tara:strand:+ start:155 stop:409 length:255 start_codon:yes stop_codon:yes gene_type:complete
MDAYVYAVIVNKLPSALANDYIPVSLCDMVAGLIPEPPHLRLLQQSIGSPVNIRKKSVRAAAPALSVVDFKRCLERGIKSCCGA